MYFFFFQAEDGIRDTSVTGVQTCALPIYGHQRVGLWIRRRGPLFRGNAVDHVQRLAVRADRAGPADADAQTRARSEERRVGNEGGARVGGAAGRATREGRG